jgi:subtilisin family serine protease
METRQAHVRRFLALMAVAASVAACSGGGEADEPTRNLSVSGISSPITRPGVATPVTTLPPEPGGIIGSVMSRVVETVRPVVPDLSAYDVPRGSVWERASLEKFRAAEKVAGYLPVIVQLPVPFDPRIAAEAIKAGASAGNDALWPEGVPHSAVDPEIARATGQLVAAMSELPRWSDRSVSLRAMYEAADIVYPPANGAGDDVNTPDSGTVLIKPEDRSITITDYVGQIGFGPHIRTLLTVDEIDQLAAKGLIVGVSHDRYASTTLDDSTEIIGSLELSRFHGFDGSGTAIAILDTGVLSAHDAFSGKIVDEGCWALDSTCPGGRTQTMAAGGGEPCGFHTQCDHGTHVAGIAVGAARSGPSVDHQGVAPAADLIAYRVFGQNPETGKPGTWATDFTAALAAVAAQTGNHQIVAANMSLGGGDYTSACDVDYLYTTMMIDVLTLLDVAVVISSGNDGWTDRIGAPGCITKAVTVGATQYDDQVTSYSNMAAGMIDLMAPGGSGSGSWQIDAPSVASDMRTANDEGKQGTSMAAPHVAGALALLKEADPTATTYSLVEHLMRTGIVVTDGRIPGGVQAPRIDLARAVSVPTARGLTTVEEFSGARQTYSTGGVARQLAPTEWFGSINVNPDPGSGFDTTSADVAIAYVEVRGGELEWMRTASMGAVVIPAEEIGYSATACRATGPARAYRMEFDPRYFSLGRNQLELRVSEGTIVDGVSVLFISDPVAGGGPGARVILAEGLAVLNDDNSVVGIPLTSSVALDSRDLTLHIGVADGQTAGESGLLLKTSTDAVLGSYITPADDLAGVDGRIWDDRTYDLSGLGITGTPGILMISHDGVNPALSDRDCLAVVYAALNVGRRPITLSEAPVLERLTAATSEIVITED